MAKNRLRSRKKRTIRGQGQVTPIDVLHDDVLLDIFDFYVGISQSEDSEEAWQLLVHVCRRWRCLVFGSPRRLNLRLVCTHWYHGGYHDRTSARKSLDVWPALPLVVGGIISSTSVDKIIYAIGHSDRVCDIHFTFKFRQETGYLQRDKVLAAMQVPFPALTRLRLHCDDGQALVIPDTFLGGSAPHLQHLNMDRISFPAIPDLLLSATHLVSLHLCDIPQSGYISPEAMAACLSVSTSLDTLSLTFLPSSRSRPDRKRGRPLPVTRSILPELNFFLFEGASEYLEDLVARIDTPRLDDVFITFLDQLNFKTWHLVQFISRTPTFEEPNDARVGWNSETGVVVQLRSSRHRIYISCEESDPQVLSIAQICTKCSPPLPAVENLRLYYNYSESGWKATGDVGQWLELLRLFTATKNLYLPEGFQPKIGSVLQELVGGRTMEVLPSLQNIYLMRFELSGPFQEAIGQFLAARQLFGHPITVFPCEYV